MANDLNSVILVGNVVKDLGADPKSLHYTQSGLCIACVSIACNRSKTTQNGERVNDVNYFDITIFGKTAEALKPYLTKGKKIAVQGFLKQDRWNDQQGNSKSRISVIAENIQLLSRNEQGGQQQYQQQNVQQNQNYSQQQYQPQQIQQQYQQQYSAPPQNYQAVQNQQMGDMNGGFPEDIPF